MISSLPESITNWHSDRSVALGASPDFGAVAQVCHDEFSRPTMMTDARGLARAIAASRAMRSNESGPGA
jgi:hypothetical protein